MQLAKLLPVAAAGALFSSSVAQSAPVTSAASYQKAVASQSVVAADIIKVSRNGREWHGRHHWRHRHDRWGHRHGSWWGPSVLGLIIGGTIAASRRDYNDRWEDCDDTYVSFRWSDGTYQPYGGGPRRLCPYLRG